MILPDGTFLELMIAGETRKAIDYWTGDLNGRTLKDAALERMLKGLIDALTKWNAGAAFWTSARYINIKTRNYRRQGDNKRWMKRKEIRPQTSVRH